MKATMYEAMQAIASERAYQDKKWPLPAHAHSETEFLVYIEHHLNEAKKKASTLDFQDRANVDATLDDIRKVAALCVACMEQHGAPVRESSPPPAPSWEVLRVSAGTDAYGRVYINWYGVFEGVQYANTTETTYEAPISPLLRESLERQGHQQAAACLEMLQGGWRV